MRTELIIPPKLWTPERGFQAASSRDLYRAGIILPIAGGAGNYPDVPGHRMAYDRDGTAVTAVDVDTGIVTELTGTQKQAMNDEDGDGFSLGGTERVAFIFPERRDLVGYFACVAFQASGPGALEKSTDTTNGIDGTWTTVISPWINSGAFNPNYRSAIQTISAQNIIALRFSATPFGAGDTWKVVHLFGNIEPTAVHWLRFWQPVTDAEVGGAYFDWGNAPRGSSADKTFRIKNSHATLTANNIVVNIEALTDTTPTVASQYLLSTDGTNFSASINIGNLAPGAISGTLYIRRNTPSNAVLSVWTARMLAVANTWT